MSSIFSLLLSDLQCRGVADILVPLFVILIKYLIIVSQFSPNPDFKFPRSVNGWSFQICWLHLYARLACSGQVNVSFSIPCVLFATITSG